jgi:hypothetical protein
VIERLGFNAISRSVLTPIKQKVQDANTYIEKRKQAPIEPESLS